MVDTSITTTTESKATTISILRLPITTYVKLKYMVIAYLTLSYCFIVEHCRILAYLHLVHLDK